MIFCQLARILRWLLLQVAPVADLPFRFQTWLAFPQFAIVADFSQVVTVADFFAARTSPSLTSFFRLRLSLIFSKLCLSLTFLPARTCLSLTYFSGWAGRWHFSQVAPVPNFYFRFRTSLTFSQVAPVAEFYQTVPVADFSLGYACRRFFSGSHESVTDFLFKLRTSLVFSQVAPVADLYFRMCTLVTPSHVAPIADFPQGCACHWLFSLSHHSVADFIFKLRPSLTFFTVRARRSEWAHCWLFPTSRPLLIFHHFTHVVVFYRVARVRRRLVFQIAPVADLLFQRSRPSLIFIPECAHWWLFPRSRPLLIFPQVSHVFDFSLGCRSQPLTSLWDCARLSRWNFSQVAPVADFSFRVRTFSDSFPGRSRCWFFPRLRISLTFFPARTSPSLTSFSGCARLWHFSQVAPVAYFYFMLRASLIFSQVAPVADFSLGYACRWLIFRVARVRRWLPFQSENITVFFPGCARRWFFPRLRMSKICFSVSHESLTDFLFRLRTWLVFSQFASVADFSQNLPVADFFWQLAEVRRWFLFQDAPVADFFQVGPVTDFIASSHESVADFFFRLRPSMTFSQVAPVSYFYFMLRAALTFSQVAPVADFSLGYACHRFVFPCHTSPSLTSFSGCGHGWLFPVCAHGWFSPKCACRWLFFGSPHKSVAGFFFRLRLSLISSKLNPPLTLLPARMSPSLTFFSSCAGRWHFSQVAPVVFSIHVARIADFFPGRASRWLFPRLSMSQIFFPCHASPWLASFLGCGHGWLFPVCARR